MSEQHFEICRFCENNKARFYCEDCGVSICGNCVSEEKIEFFKCQDCDSRSISSLTYGTKRKCTECHSENVIKITQHSKTCPKCHSNNIANIYEKKEDIESNFLELIKETRSLVDPFQEINSDLELLRERLEKARNPPVKCYHHPKLEKDLLSLFKYIIYLKSQLAEKISLYFRHIYINKEYIFNIYNQPNSNIKIIEGILDNLKRSHESISEYINENIEKIDRKTEKFSEKLSFIEDIKDEFSSFKSYIKLADDEKPIFAVKAKLVNGMNNKQDVFKRNKGKLFITNYDLSFVHEHGFLNKKTDMIFKAPVNDITKVAEKGRFPKRLYIQFEYGKYEFSMNSDDFAETMEHINLAREFNDDSAFDRDSAEELRTVDISLSDIKNYIEEGINSFFNLKCVYNNKQVSKIDAYKQMIPKGNDPLEQGFQKPMVSEQTENMWNVRAPSSDLEYKKPASMNFRQAMHADLNFQQFPQPARAVNSNQAYQPRTSRASQVNYYKNNYYQQDPFRTDRYQNYEPAHPQESMRPENYYHGHQGNPHYQEEDIINNRKILMGQLNKVSRTIPSMEASDPMSTLTPSGPPKEFSKSPGSYMTNFHRNHLSQHFEPKSEVKEAPYPRYRSPFDRDREEEQNDQEINELKKSRFSIKQTLKKLDAKFDRGFLSESDYFRIFNNLQQDLYTIEEQLSEMQEKSSRASHSRASFRPPNKYIS